MAEPINSHSSSYLSFQYAELVSHMYDSVTNKMTITNQRRIICRVEF